MAGGGVRSWNATDSASSVSDAYSNASNHSTFLGTFIGTPAFLFFRFPSYSLLLFSRKFQAHFPVTIGIVTPVLAHLDEQKKVHGDAHDLGDFLPRIRTDRLDGGAAFSEHDLALALALDKDRLLDADRLVLAFGPAIGLDRGLIRQFLMQLAIDLLAGNFRRQMPHRRIRHLVLG